MGGAFNLVGYRLYVGGIVGLSTMFRVSGCVYIAIITSMIVKGYA